MIESLNINLQKKIKKNIIYSFIIKGLSILVQLVLIPLTINYINAERYGIWLTLMSIVSWFTFFDIGLGNGLRNKLTEALAKKDIIKAKSIVSTSYIVLTITMLIVTLLFNIINPNINWTKILNIDTDLRSEINMTILIIFNIFSLQLILQLFNSILIAKHQAAKSSAIILIGNLLSLLFIIILKQVTTPNLINLSLIFSGIPFIIILFYSVYQFKFGSLIEISPSIKFFKKSLIKEIFSLGINFFIIQIAVVIIYQMNNLLIIRYFGAIEVTQYNISFKYFGIITMIFNIITIPYWSAFTDAFIRKEIEWIKQRIKNLLYIWASLVLIILFMLFFSKSIYSFWIGNDIMIPNSISIFIAFYVVIVTFNNIFLTFINGVGMVKLQTYITLFVIITYFPLAYIFVKYLNMGLSGLIINSCIAQLYFLVISPIQYKKIINFKKGIWTK